MDVEKEFKRQLEVLEFAVTEITPYDEFKLMLKKSIEKNIPLRVKCGIDPTNVDVTLGHLVPYGKMRAFQDLGHIGVVIIGDYTARIGDPTGKTESRPTLSKEQVKINGEKYMEQVYSILDKDRTEIRYQSEWFNKTDLQELMSWASETTVAKLLGHETFSSRLEQERPLGLHELFYPVLQGMDSVFVKADVELGGSDQKFNVLMGRDYQKARNMRPQVAILTPLLTGLCGTQKMSKSLGNYIGVLDEPFDKFGKVMSIPDDLMENYFKYAARVSPEQLKKYLKDLSSGELHPNEAKKQLAQKVVAIFHGEEVAEKMRQQFEAVFKKGKIPDEVPEYELTKNEELIYILTQSEILSSNSEVRRMCKQKAIGVVDGEKFEDPAQILDTSFKGKVLKIGKRKFLKLV